jgi:hypothetical protein
MALLGDHAKHQQQAASMFSWLRGLLSAACNVTSSGNRC